MTVAAFVLALIGTVVGAESLTWNIVAFLLQGAPSATARPDARRLVRPAHHIAVGAARRLR